jgi:TM2 domain-containing membrane protein YozV
VPPPYPSVAQYPTWGGASGESDKSFITTWLLAWFLGVLGVDRFYLGKIGTGVAKLLTLGGLGVWAFIDLILVLTGSQKDKHGRPLSGYAQNRTVAWSITGAVWVLGLISNILSRTVLAG